MKNICLFGNSGVGKTYVAHALQQQYPEEILYEIRNFRTDADVVRSQLQQMKFFVAVFILTTEGGRLRSEDAELMQLFCSRKECVIIVNKTTMAANPCLSSHIQSLFQEHVDIVFLPDHPNIQELQVCLEHILLSHSQPYQPFLWPHEELSQLQEQIRIEEQEQECKLLELEKQKERLLKEQEETQHQLAFANKQLKDQEKAKQAAIAATYARQAEIQKQNAIREQQRRQAEFDAQRRQEEERQRQRDAQFRAQIARAGR